MPDEVEVEVEVTEAAPDSSPAGDVVVVNPPATAPPSLDGDLVVLVAQHGERITALELAVAALAPAVLEAEVTAEVALDEVERVAEETEEAVATLAEEAEAVTPEVVAEVEDIAPAREHPWYAGRKMFSRSGAE